MTAYASVADYTARYGEVSDETMLTACLEDASAVIDAKLDACGIDPCDGGEEYADRLMRVCRSMANRIMPNGANIPQGATGATITGGPYSESFTFSTTYGTPKMLPSEMDLLGLPRGAYRSVQAHTWRSRCEA